jgi:two-component system nitrogen regulation response regulator GlnG
MAPAQVIEPKDLPPEVGVSQPDRRVAPPLAAPAATATELISSAPIAMGASALPVYTTPTVALAIEGWENALEAEANALLESGQADVWDTLTRRFESRLIQAALASTKGRRIEAAQKLGIGRNTITRKIQELGLE